MGENGAGKSTLMNILGGVIQPDQGRIQLKGEPYVVDGPRLPRHAASAWCTRKSHCAPTSAVAENIFMAETNSRGGLLDGNLEPQHARRTGPGRAASGAGNGAGRRPANRQPADRRDRQGADAELRCAHFRRTDRRADGNRGQRTVLHHSRPQGTRHRHHLHQPSHGRDLCPVGSHHRVSRRRIRRDADHRRDDTRRGRHQDGRPSAARSLPAAQQPDRLRTSA